VIETEFVDPAVALLPQTLAEGTTSPSSGRIRPDRAAISVDFPEPDGPITMVTCP